MNFHQVLKGQIVQLEQFSEIHVADLRAIAFEESIWEHLPYQIRTPDNFKDYVKQIIVESENQSQITYVIRLLQNNAIIGCTSFLNIDRQNRKLEIGGTWIAPSAWGTGVNSECKLLLLTHCFEDLNVMRVELLTRESNIRSQKAIEKNGGVKEGVIRCHRINADGSFRNTVIYSYIQPEWAIAKAALQQLQH